MVQSIKLVASAVLLATVNGLTARSKFISRSIATPNRPQVISYKPKYFVDYRSHRQSNSRLTSTYVEARPISRPFLSSIPRRVLTSLQLASKTFKRRGPQRILIGTVLAVIMLFGPAFSPAANAATMTASPVSVAPTVFGTQSRALGSFNFFPTKAELELCFRLLYAACSGAFIGLERSSHDRPAGVRTMALVGLGACLFTVCSIHGFLPSSALGYAPGSPMLANVKSDLARLAANVASGVGFIGAGAIHKSKLHGNGTEAQNVVAGLTTASAIWVSAAVGVASATGLYFVSLVAALSTVCILKFAKVTKDDEPGFSWGPRPLELEDQEMVQHQEKGTGAGMMHTDFGRIQETIPSTTALHHKKKHAQQKPKASKLDTVQLSPQGRVEIRGSKIDIKTVNDQSLEQYLRKYDKEEGYSCLEQDVRVLESRVQQSSSTFRP